MVYLLYLTPCLTLARDCHQVIGYMSTFSPVLCPQAIMLEDGWLKLGHCANADSEGYIEMQSNDEEQKYGKIEARVRLELGCISQCIVIDLEGRTAAAKYNPNMVPAY